MTMKKSAIRITKKDAFGVGRLQGMKDAFEEIMDYLDCYPDNTPGVCTIRKYLRKRISTIYNSNIDDAFKQKEIIK